MIKLLNTATSIGITLRNTHLHFVKSADHKIDKKVPKASHNMKREHMPFAAACFVKKLTKINEAF